MGDKETNAQVKVDDVNVELRDMYKSLKKAPNNIPFLFDLSAHVVSSHSFSATNDSDLISKGMFLTIYEEMKASAYDTSILEPTVNIEARMRERSKNDTVNVSILNAEYATFLADAFETEGQYYYLTDTSIKDVPNRTLEPFLLKSVFVSTLTRATNYFRRVHYRLDTTFIYSNKKLLGSLNKDLDPRYAQWKIDFGDGNGWRSFNPQEVKSFFIDYPDTGLYEISVGIFSCDPFPLCDSYPSKLSKTSIYILNNTVPVEPDVTYQFSNVTVGLYKGCGETKGGIYIPQKPFIVVEGIDLLNIRSIPVLYEDNIRLSSSKKLGLLSEFNYDFYVVNFNNTHLDLRENAKGVVELLDYLKSIMETNEQFVVFAESMGGIISRYALTYMENELYTKNSASNKPLQMHNTRMYISNDAPHQGANVPLSVQALYRNMQNSTAYQVVKNVKYILPILNEERYWNDMLNSKSVQQLLVYHVDANGPHPNRIDFMNDLISLNPQTNGYPAYCKMMAFTDGLLSGQPQLTINNNILNPGDALFSADLNIKLRVTYYYTIQLLDYKLKLNTVNKDNASNAIINTDYTYASLKFKGCFRKILRHGFIGVITCATKYTSVSKEEPQPTISSNYDTDAAGIFPVLSILSSEISVHNLSVPPFDINTILDKNSGELKFTAVTSSLTSNPKKKAWNVSAKLKLSSQGFAFIPVQSAIDFDYYKTLNIPADYNLVKEDIQGFLFANSPFHVISGFNYTEDNYPLKASPEFNNTNWSHGYFTNTSINDGTEERYLTLEIGSSKIYLNNLNLGTRLADFKFSEINVGVHNPYYIYDLANIGEKAVKYVYSRENSFEFREPGAVNLFYSDNINQGPYKNIEGNLYKIKVAIKPCGTVHKKVQSSGKPASLIAIYPNPFQDELSISNLKKDAEYSIKIHNVLGLEIFNYHLRLHAEDQNVSLNTEDLPKGTMYIISIIENNQLIVKQKIIKI